MKKIRPAFIKLTIKNKRIQEYCFRYSRSVVKPSHKDINSVFMLVMASRSVLRRCPKKLSTSSIKNNSRLELIGQSDHRGHCKFQHRNIGQRFMVEANKSDILPAKPAQDVNN